MGDTATEQVETQQAATQQAEANAAEERGTMAGPMGDRFKEAAEAATFFDKLQEEIDQSGVESTEIETPAEKPKEGETPPAAEATAAEQAAKAAADAQEGADKEKPAPTAQETELAQKVDELQSRLDSGFKQLGDREEALRGREKALEVNLDEFAELKKFKARMESDPYATLEEDGLGTFQEWGERALADGKPGANEKTRKLEKELDGIKEDRASEKEASAKAEEQSALDQQVAAAMVRFDQTVEKGGEKYQALDVWPKVYKAIFGADLNVHQVAKDTAIAYHEATKQDLSFEQLAEVVSGDFQKRIDGLPEGTLEKFLETATPEATKETPITPEPKEKPKAQEKAPDKAKTITNDLAATPIPSDLDALDGTEKTVALAKMMADGRLG